MRLIDADKLKKKMQKESTEAWKLQLTAKVETVMNQCIEYVNDEPTIDAIPVELIEEYARKLCELEDFNHVAYRGMAEIGGAIFDMVRNLREENG